MGLKMLAKELLTAAAVETLSTELRVIGNNSVSNVESLDLWADGCNNTDSLVSWN